MSAPHLSLPRSPISKSATAATVAPTGAGVIQAPPLPGSSWASPPQRPPLWTQFLPPWCPCWPVLRGDSSSSCLPALVSREQVRVSQPPSSHARPHLASWCPERGSPLLQNGPTPCTVHTTHRPAASAQHQLQATGCAEAGDQTCSQSPCA